MKKKSKKDYSYMDNGHKTEEGYWKISQQDFKKFDESFDIDIPAIELYWKGMKVIV